MPALVDSIDRTAKAGADIAIISANTVHTVFYKVAAKITILVLSILDVASDYCLKKGYTHVGILGTTPTVRYHIYDEPLGKRGIEAVYPPLEDQEKLMDIIIHELILGIFKVVSDGLLEDIAKRLVRSCDAIVLGCTEVLLVLTREGCWTKLIDTTRILVHAALDAVTRKS